jgi:hypothetical protein
LDCYKYLSSYSGFQVWQITPTALGEWMNKCPGLYGPGFDFNAVVISQKGIIANLVDLDERKNKNKNLPDNLVRHQFLSLLVKVPKDKYISRSK